MIRPFFFGLASFFLLSPHLHAQTLELKEILIVGKSKSGTSKKEV